MLVDPWVLGASRILRAIPTKGETMSFDVICKATDDRERWLAERLKGLTATVAPQLLGVHRWGSLLGTYLHYRNPEVSEPTEDMLWGRDRQLAVIQNMGRRLGVKARESEELVRSKDYPWMLATLDGWVVPALSAENIGPEPLPFEVKATRHPRAAEDWADGVPPHVNAQVQWQLAVTGKPRALVAVTIMGAPPVYAWVDRDQHMIGNLMQAGTAFWTDIQDGCPPDPDGTDAAGDSVRDMNGEIEEGKTIELGIDAVTLTEEWAQCAKLRLELEKAGKALKQQIDLLVGDATIGVLPGEDMGRWKRIETQREGYTRVDGLSAIEVAACLRGAGLADRVSVSDVEGKLSRQLRKVK